MSLKYIKNNRNVKTFRKYNIKKTYKHKKIMKGGLLGNNEVLQYIDSIGYEFESDYFVPIFKKPFDKNNKTIKYNLDNNLYNYNQLIAKYNSIDKNDYYYFKTYAIDKVQISSDKIDNNVINEFDLSYDMGGFFDESEHIPTNFTIPLTIFNQEANNNIIIFNDPRITKNDISTELKSYPDYDIPDVEFHSTYYKLDNFNRVNIIDETFKDTINKMYNFIMNPISTTNVDITSTDLSVKILNTSAKLYAYDKGINLIQILPNDNPNKLIEISRFSPQMTFISDITKSLDVVKYLLTNNFYTSNDPNREQNILLVNETIKAFDIAGEYSSMLTDAIVKLYKPKSNNSIDRTKLQSLLTYYYYKEWFIFLYEQYKKNDGSSSKYVPDALFENINYYKDITLINIRNSTVNLLQLNFDDDFLDFLFTLADDLQILEKNNTLTKFMKDKKSNSLLKIIYKYINIFKTPDKPHSFISYMFLDTPYEYTYPDKASVVQSFPVVENKIAIEFRGFNMVLNKFFKEIDYLNKAEVHNQSLNGDYSLEFLYKYASGNTTISNRMTRKRKMDQDRDQDKKMKY
jgi:hypothetical protein